MTAKRRLELGASLDFGLDERYSGRSMVVSRDGDFVDPAPELGLQRPADRF